MFCFSKLPSKNGPGTYVSTLRHRTERGVGWRGIKAELDYTADLGRTFRLFLGGGKVRARLISSVIWHTHERNPHAWFVHHLCVLLWQHQTSPRLRRALPFFFLLCSPSFPAVVFRKGRRCWRRARNHRHKGQKRHWDVSYRSSLDFLAFGRTGKGWTRRGGMEGGEGEVGFHCFDKNFAIFVATEVSICARPRKYLVGGIGLANTKLWRWWWIKAAHQPMVAALGLV